MDRKIKLTQYSHGAGCGCKISPALLNEILSQGSENLHFPHLLTGNEHNEDAAVYEIDNDRVIISTTDFFMPIVDDPFDFGAISSVNAISDIYAMAAKPLLAISILGWPVDKISPEIAKIVLAGARDACNRAGIPLAGGHSIDTPEPIFGLAVTGITKKPLLRMNSGATENCELYLTKPLGVGIMTTAQKQGLLSEADFETVRKSMLMLNDIGKNLGRIDCVKAVTDVTGFGLIGHLTEMCRASGLSAEIVFNNIPLLNGLEPYIEMKTFPGGTFRNYKSYATLVSDLSERQKIILCDPQTSGGLLIAVEKNNQPFKDLLKDTNLSLQPIGTLVNQSQPLITIR